MKQSILLIRLMQVLAALAVLLLAHYGFGWVAAIIVVAEPLFRWFKRNRSWAGFINVSPELIFGLSIVSLISLTRPPIGQSVFSVTSQVGLAIIYAIWLMYRPRIEASQQLGLLLVGANQMLAVGSIFLASAYWGWPNLIVVVSTWVVSFLNAWWVLQQRGERAAQILAASWALIAAEIAWILHAWQVNYIIADGLMIIPQASIVTLGVGYCMLSIYTAHSAKRLSRRRLVEYVSIAGVILAIVIAGTRWNGTS